MDGHRSRGWDAGGGMPDPMGGMHGPGGGGPMLVGGPAASGSFSGMGGMGGVMPGGMMMDAQLPGPPGMGGPALGHAFSSMGPGLPGGNMGPHGGGLPMPPGMGGGGGGLGFGFDGGFGGFNDGGFPRHGGGRGGFGGGGGGGRFNRRGRFGGRGAPPLPSGPSRGDANDYCQHFVDTGQRPQNFLRDAHMTDKDRFSEYPKLRDLVAAKDEQVKHFATPPMFLKADLRQLPLTVETFGTKFDVVLVDPPWEEYVRRAPGADAVADSWPWQDIQALDIGNIADSPAFVFLWCGSAEGLDAGRHCLRKWGFRRCEDICWIKTNKDSSRKYMLHQDPHNCIVHTKEHCLMGVRGNVRRSTDGHIIHANVDTDVVISEEPEYGSTAKPEEIYAIIEHFSLGRRRLELFGEDRNIRPGWVTVGRDLTSSNFDPKAYADHFRLPNGVPFTSSGGVKPGPGAPHLLPSTEFIEELRPRSPPGGRR